jgi:hypothetical protein
MTATFIELTEDEFDARYPLVPNHINPNATWGSCDGPGCLFETYGEEFEFVRQQDPAHVWTLVDGDDGDMYVINGLHFVNRVGYLVSTLPAPEDFTVQVHIPMSHDDDEPGDEAS